MKVKEFIKENKLEPDEIIFIRIYQKTTEEKFAVENIPAKYMNSKIKLIQGNYGGREYDYSCYRLILTK